MTQRPLYEHTQPGWLMRLALAMGALIMLVSATLPLPRGEHLPTWTLYVGAALMVVAGLCFSSLTVRISNENLQLHFGFGWPRKSVPLADIVAADITRTTFWEGWGVHRTRRGWLYNVSGYDAVIVQRRDGSALLVGSDEPRRLKAAIDNARGRS